jgi:hypothetical protein
MARKTRKVRPSDWVVAIPTYKRTDILKEKTLATLQKYGIEPSRIYIFVADKDEEKQYKEAIPATSYNKIIVAEKGLHNARNVINTYFPKGKKIVEADDDIRGFIEFDESKSRHEKPLTSLKRLIDRGFAEAEKHGARLWGLYPSANGFFMKDTVTTDLRLIVGSFWGQINPGKEILLDFSEKEDYLRTLMFYEKDGKVVRLNFASPQTPYYKTPGGMQEDDKRLVNQEKAVKEILKRYPTLVKRNPNRKSGFPEIRLRDPSATSHKTRKLTKHT